MLSLEPLIIPENFNLYEKECFEYLINNNINKNDILFLKEVYDKEGIKFSIKTFKSFSLDELKGNLENRNKNVLKNIIIIIYKFLFLKLVKCFKSMRKCLTRPSS